MESRVSKKAEDVHLAEPIDARDYLKIRPLAYDLDRMVTKAIDEVEEQQWFSKDEKTKKEIDALLNKHASLILKISRNLERDPLLTDSLRALITTKSKGIYKHYLHKVLKGAEASSKTVSVVELSEALSVEEKKIEEKVGALVGEVHNLTEELKGIRESLPPPKTSK